MSLRVSLDVLDRKLSGEVLVSFEAVTESIKAGVWRAKFFIWKSTPNFRIVFFTINLQANNKEYNFSQEL